MSFLDHLTDHQRRAVISLPYRIGLMVSQSDTTGGDSSDEEELRALEGILNAYAEDVMGSETMQYIITQTVRQRDQWEKWAQELDAIPNDCRITIDLLKEHGDPKDVNAFQTQMMEIAEAVALAFREYDEIMSVVEKAKIYFTYFRSLMESRKAQKTPMSLDQFLRISPDERKALKRLAHALGCDYI